MICHRPTLRLLPEGERSPGHEDHPRRGDDPDFGDDRERGAEDLQARTELSRVQFPGDVSYTEKVRMR